MSPSAERARSLHARLLALSTTELAPPHVDPRVAALAALGLVDFIRSDEAQSRFAELEWLGGFDPATVDDLEMLADALLNVVDAFDAAPRKPRPIAVPQVLEVECRARRGTLSVLLSERATSAPAVARALKLLRRSYGPIDLAVDLRTLAALVEQNARAIEGADEYEADLPASTRALARELEELLHSADTPGLQQARSALHRMWAVFEPSYRAVAEIGRELFADAADAIFPTLEAIADIERTARQESSSRRTAAAIVENAIPSSRRAMSRRPSSRRMPAVRELDATTPPLSLEVTLHATSESNLWLGFSQDIAEGGIFVATYEHRPIGARMDLALHLDHRDEPLHVSGVVHWMRPQGSGDDMPVGVGVRLVDVSKEVAKMLQAFAVRRTPIFYDD